MLVRGLFFHHSKRDVLSEFDLLKGKNEKILLKLDRNSLAFFLLKKCIFHNNNYYIKIAYHEACIYYHFSHF